VPDVVVVDQVHTAPAGAAEPRLSGFAAGFQNNKAIRTDAIPILPASVFTVGRDSAGRAIGSFVRVDVSTGIPLKKGAVISDAYLEVRSSAIGTDDFQIAIGALQKDGIWNVLDLAGPRVTLSADIQRFLVAATGGGFGPGIAGTSLHPMGYIDPGGPGIGAAGLQYVGQSFGAIAAIINTCTSIDVSLSRAGAAGGSVRLRVYNCTANDGSDDRPTGSPIATSDTVAVSSLTATTPPPAVTFPFSGGNRFTVPLNQRRVAIVDWFSRSRVGGGALVAKTDYLNVGAVVTPSSTPNGSTVVGSPEFAAVDSGWGPRNYPSHLVFPWLYGNAGEYLPGTDRLTSLEEFTIPGRKPYAAPIGSVVAMAAPSFPSVGQWVKLPGLAPVIQAIVDHASFDDTLTPNLIGLAINTTTGAANNELRLGDDVRLVISGTWEGHTVKPPGVATYSRVSIEPVVGSSGMSVSPAVRVSDTDLEPTVRSGSMSVDPVVSTRRTRIDATVGVDHIDVEPLED